MEFNLRRLMQEIEGLRIELMTEGEKRGLGAAEVLHKSQLLDKLINEYYQVKGNGSMDEKSRRIIKNKNL